MRTSRIGSWLGKCFSQREHAIEVEALCLVCCWSGASWHALRLTLRVIDNYSGSFVRCCRSSCTAPAELLSPCATHYLPGRSWQADLAMVCRHCHNRHSNCLSLRIWSGVPIPTLAKHWCLLVWQLQQAETRCEAPRCLIHLLSVGPHPILLIGKCQLPQARPDGLS